MSFVPSIIALSAMAVIALWLTITRGRISANSPALPGAARLALLALLMQSLHFAEEATTGLNIKLPEFFGLAPVSLESFVSVNVVALLTWVLSIVALAARSSVGLFPLWFLAVASVSNALLHPALALATGGYFPGLITSPIVGASGVLLLRGLHRVTRAEGGPANTSPTGSHATH